MASKGSPWLINIFACLLYKLHAERCLHQCWALLEMRCSFHHYKMDLSLIPLFFLKSTVSDVNSIFFLYLLFAWYFLLFCLKACFSNNAQLSLPDHSAHHCPSLLCLAHQCLVNMPLICSQLVQFYSSGRYLSSFDFSSPIFFPCLILDCQVSF